jgi:serine phosphatase RsbU (regulator of sigma subunit)
MKQQVVDATDKPLKDIAYHLLDDIKCFTSDVPQSDDITMLLLRKEKS